VIVHVDEAGGDHQTGRIDDALALGLGEIADAADAAVEDADVCLETLFAGAVDDEPAADQDVELLLSEGSSGQNEEEGEGFPHFGIVAAKLDGC